jgi:hypothetical protein
LNFLLGLKKILTNLLEGGEKNGKKEKSSKES